MNKHTNPIEFLINFALANGADHFIVNNANDELKKLKDSNLKYKNIFEHPVAYGKLNDKNDLYDLRLSNNPCDNQDKIVPLYSNRQEFLTGDWKGYNHYGKFTK